MPQPIVGDIKIFHFIDIKQINNILGENVFKS